jgi:inositol-phosphate phosphatase/L-galactose 1-phosphate phosphatase/histidinol-phosphatase
MYCRPRAQTRRGVEGSTTADPVFAVPSLSGWASRGRPGLSILEDMSFATHTDLARVQALAGRLADSARHTVRQYFRLPIAVEQKADLSPVTLADRAIETEMRRLIRAEFPTHGIRGEEFPSEDGDEFTWVLDPIDGTKSFITGFPLFGSLIALAQGTRPVFGVLEAPALGERWVGCEGLPTLFNGAPVRTSNCQSIEQARVYTTTIETFRGADRELFERATGRAALRRYGGDCYLYGLLASGFCDLVIEMSMKPHDYLALVPVVEGAGGKMSDWSGAPLSTETGDKVLAAATTELWEQALESLRPR